MSQAGLSNAANSNPAIPTTFTTNSGVATPAANNLNVFGGTGATTSGSGSTITISTTSSYNPVTDVILRDDFTTQTQASDLGWVSNTSGGDFNTPVAAENRHPGINQLSTAGSTTGTSWYFLGGNSPGNGSFVLGNGAIDMSFFCKLSNLSNVTDRYLVAIGFGDSKNTSAPLHSSGVYFQYSDNLNSGNFQLIGANGGSLTTTNSSTAATTNWTQFQIQINAAATLATFLINGVSVGTVASNLPTSNQVCPWLTIAKTAGTNARLLNVDLFYLTQTMVTGRR